MKRTTAILSACFSIAALGFLVYLVWAGKIGVIQYDIRGLGIWGVVLAVTILALFCVLPIPSEFLIFWNMEMFGVVMGTLYSWIGGVIGAVFAMYLSRWAAKPLITRLVGRYLQQVDHWIEHNRAFGLLSLRFIPFVPYHAVNYVLGVLHVKLWPFVWTTAIGILPFDVAMGCLYSGVRKGTITMLLFGISLFLLLVLISWKYRRRWQSR